MSIPTATEDAAIEKSSPIKKATGVFGGVEVDDGSGSDSSDIDFCSKKRAATQRNLETSVSKRLRLDSPTLLFDEESKSVNGKGEDVTDPEAIEIEVCPPEGDYGVLANAIEFFFDNSKEQNKYINNERDNGNYDPKNTYGLHRRGIMGGWHKVFKQLPNLRLKLMETWASRPACFLRERERKSKVWGQYEGNIFDDGRKRLGHVMKHTKFYHSLTNTKTKEMHGTFQVDLGGGNEYVEGSENCGSAAKIFEDKEGDGDDVGNELIFDKLSAIASAIRTVRALQHVEKIVDEHRKADADYELKYLAAKAANQNRPPREANPVLEAKRSKITNTDALCAKRVVVSSTWNCDCEV